jgi:hypothetical protein
MGNHCLGVSRYRTYTGLFGITEMNERIKQIWEDSEEIKVRYPEQGSPVSVSEQTLEKFAELIIRECARFADNSPQYIDGHDIIEHFGVQE